MKTSNIARAALAALAFAAAGCTVEKVGTLDLVGLCSPPDSGSCSYSSTCGKYLISRPFVYSRLDATTFNEMVLAVELRNQVASNSDQSSGQTNSNDAYLDSYDLSYSTTAFPEPIESIEFPAAATWVPAAQGSSAGSAVTIATVMPEAIVASIDAKMQAHALTTAVVRVNLRIKGHFGGGGSGRSFETATLTFPVDFYQDQWVAPVCPTAGDILVTCPAAGQTATYSCVTP